MRNAVYEHKARLVQLLGSDEPRQRMLIEVPTDSGKPSHRRVVFARSY